MFVQRFLLSDLSRRAKNFHVGTVSWISRCKYSPVSLGQGDGFLGAEKQKYQPREFVLEPHEVDDARIIRKVAFDSSNRSVEDVLQSLRSDQYCNRIRISTNLFDSLLHRFGDDWKSAMGLFRWASSHIGYAHSQYAYDKMVDLLGRARQFNRMWDLVHEMHTSGFVRLETIAKVMRRLVGARKWKDAVKLFDDLESMGIKKNVESMNILLDALCKDGKADLAREVFMELKANVRPNDYTFNIFVHGWCNVRRLEEAMWTVQEMKGYGFQPSVITYSTIIQAYCTQFNFHKVYELLDEMHTEGCLPNVVTYTVIMKSLAKSNRIDEAMNIFERMKSTGCKPDTLFYNSLINILGKAGQVSEASHIFEIDMQTNGVARSLSTYNTMISIFCLHNQEQNAFAILNEMEISSFRPDLQTYTPLLKLCLTKAEKEDLRDLLSDIVNKHHLSLDRSTYSLLIHGLCRIDKIEWACLLFREMIDRDILPRHQTCRLLLEEAGQKNFYDTVEMINDVLRQLGYCK